MPMIINIGLKGIACNDQRHLIFSAIYNDSSKIIFLDYRSFTLSLRESIRT